MASRSKKNDGVSLVMVIALGVAIALVNIAVFAYPIVCVVLFVWALTAPRRVPISGPPERLEDGAIRAEVQQLFKRLNRVEGKKSSLIERAEEAGFVTTKATDYARYDARKRGASQINRELDEVDEQIRDLESTLQEKRETATAYFLEIRKPIERWIRARPFLPAVILSLAVAAIGYQFYAVVTNTASAVGSAAEGAASRLLWQPLPQPTLAAVVFGVVCGYATLAIAYPICRARLRASIANNDFVVQLAQRIEDWHPDNAIDALLEEDAPMYEDLEEESDSNDDAVEISKDRWWEVLKVARSASGPEVKAAYRTAIVQYHTDKFPKAGPRIIEVAEAETRRINAAYEAAKYELGFA